MKTKCSVIHEYSDQPTYPPAVEEISIQIRIYRKEHLSREKRSIENSAMIYQDLHYQTPDKQNFSSEVKAVFNVGNFKGSHFHLISD